MAENHQTSKARQRVAAVAILASSFLAGSWATAQAHHGTWGSSRVTDPNNSNNLGSRTTASAGADVLFARFLNTDRGVSGSNLCESTNGGCYSVTSIYVYTPVGHRYFRSGCGRAGTHYFTGGSEPDLVCVYNYPLDGGYGVRGTRV